MDVVGHNIANFNTAGYERIPGHVRRGRSLDAAGPGRRRAHQRGTNPPQMGLGVEVSSIDAFFLVLELDGTRVYMRAGAFCWDESGNLVARGGYPAQGRMADAQGGPGDHGLRPDSERSGQSEAMRWKI
jgi:flagellar hook protein FlgE